MINNNFILIIIVITGVALGYIYYTNSSSELFVAPPLNGKVDDLSELASLSLDLSLFDVAGSLRIYGEYPVDPGTTGRRNPFAPI